MGLKSKMLKRWPNLGQMRFGLKAKLLGGLGLLFFLILASNIFSLFYFEKIHHSFYGLTEHIYPAAQEIEILSRHLRESKNWAVRYTLEENPKNLELWRKNYEGEFQKAEEVFNRLKKISGGSIQAALERVDKSFKIFRAKVTPVLEKHEERLALIQFKRDKNDEFLAIVNEIEGHLDILSHEVITRREEVGYLKKEIASIRGLFSQPLFSPLKIENQAQMEKKITDMKESFEKGVQSFDSKINGLFPYLIHSRQKQLLHKAKVLGVQLRRIVLSHQQLLNLYQNEIETLTFIWQTIEALNVAFEEVQQGTVSVTNLVKNSLSDSLSTLRSSRKESSVLIFLLMSFFIFIGIGASFFVTKKILNPLLAVALSSKKIGKGDLSQRVSVVSRDEIGELSESFNQMAMQLKHSRDEITELNRGLEKKVKERTQELELTLEDLELKNQQLVVANRLKSEFLANMSHELRTPLNSIMGFCELVIHDENQKLTPKGKKNLENVLESGKDLLALINSILDLAKIEAGKMPVEVVQFNAAEVIEDCIAVNEVLISGKNIHIEKNFSKLPLCHSDAVKFKQIVNNLLNTAIKFTEKGQVVVTLKKEDDHLVLKVRDTGIGISLENQKIIFDEFRQVDAASTRRYGGSGLGLAIVKKLTGLLGGSVDVESEEGKGSSFTVILPMCFEAQLKKAA